MSRKNIEVVVAGGLSRKVPSKPLQVPARVATPEAPDVEEAPEEPIHEESSKEPVSEEATKRIRKGRR